jgi:4-hydroxybenzoate polyprenyltransferase
VNTFRENNKIDTVPLYVDMDGTLVKTDLLAESFFALMKQNILHLLQIPFWLCKGKAYLKQQMAIRVDLDVETLPYNEEFLKFLRDCRKDGRTLYLATASNEKFAHAIADHLGIFDGVIASDADTNRTGKRKLERMVDSCGPGGFDYAGNAKVDLIIWKQAREAIVVNPHRGVQRDLKKLDKKMLIFENLPPPFKAYFKAIRPHQWTKNLLLFVPVLTAQAWLSIPATSHALLGFVAFSLCASSVYLLNDLLDLPADRRHPNKRNRPFASGDASLLGGGVLMLVLLGTGIGIGSLVSLGFLGVLLVYLTITLLYSLWLKAIAMVDVVILAGLYTLRIIAGTVAISVAPSFWLLAFAMFMFLSLALIKRCSELYTVKQVNGSGAWGRNYKIDDLGVLFSMGIASGYVSVLVLALFVNSPEVILRYSHPQGLWLLCPTIGFWIGHIWLKASRGEIHDDPLVFAAIDRGSQLVVICCVLISVLSN